MTPSDQPDTGQAMLIDPTQYIQTGKTAAEHVTTVSFHSNNNATSADVDTCHAAGATVGQWLPDSGDSCSVLPVSAGSSGRSQTEGAGVAASQLQIPESANFYTDIFTLANSSEIDIRNVTILASSGEALFSDVTPEMFQSDDILPSSINSCFA